MPARSVQLIVKPLVVTLVLSISALMTLAVLLDSSPAQANRAQPIKTSAPAMTADVSVVDFAFEPAVVTITAGSAVRWTRSNSSAFTHTTTSNTGVWNSGDLAPDVPFTHTFDTPGVYLYHCAIHSSMQATVIVVAPMPPGEVVIDGPVEGTLDTSYTFTATVNPITATQPITYLWQATHQLDAVHVNGPSDTVVFTWTIGATGTQLITATALNADGSITNTHIFMLDARHIYLPLVLNQFGP